MYKRRAHILFWHPTNPEKARYAATLAAELGAEWLETRVQETDLFWPDLLIALDCDSVPNRERAQHTQCKFWPAPTQNETAALRERILGVIGGLRLLARLDQSVAPGSVQDF